MIIPSITQVISPWVDWSKIPPGMLQHASERGTAVHDACSLIAKGEWFVADAEIKPYTESFKRWFDAYVADVILNEERLYDNRFLFDGQPDFIFRMKENCIALVDLKTPLAKSKSWRLQLSAYEYLCRESGYPVDRVGSLRLSSTGAAAKMDWYEPDRGDFTVFLSALNVARFFNS